MLARERERLQPLAGLQRGVTLGVEKVVKELHIQLVILDDEDGLGHRSTCLQPGRFPPAPDAGPTSRRPSLPRVVPRYPYFAVSRGDARGAGRTAFNMFLFCANWGLAMKLVLITALIGMGAVALTAQAQDLRAKASGSDAVGQSITVAKVTAGIADGTPWLTINAGLFCLPHGKYGWNSNLGKINVRGFEKPIRDELRKESFQLAKDPEFAFFRMTSLRI